MKGDEFRRETGEKYGCATFDYFAAREVLCHGTLEIDSLPLADLCKYARISDSVAASLSEPSSRFVLHHGWQSWSAARELASGERVKPARFIGKLNIYAYRPLSLRRFGEVASDFFCYLRAGDDYLAMVSRNPGGPPVQFRVSRRTGGLVAEVYAPGKRFVRDEAVAEICVFHAKGFFELRDRLKEIFAGFDLFSRLGFLGDPASSRLVPGGYESWYNHYANIDEKIIMDDLASIDANANFINECYIKRGKPTVFQIDDGWEECVGDWRVNAKFPNGMKPLAEAIGAKGLVPGIWIAPFIVTKKAAAFTEHPEWLLRDAKDRPVVAGYMPHWGGDFYALDLSRSDVEEYVLSLIRTLVAEWEYRFLKLDFLYAGMLPGAFANGGAPHEHYERLLRGITAFDRAPDGKSVAFLGCGAPLENSFRYLPLMRIGADTKEEWDGGIAKFLRHQCRPSAKVSMMDTIGRAALDGAVFVNDPDVVFCRESNMKLTEAEKELVAVTDFALASQAMFSDDTHAFGPEAAFTKKVVALFDLLSADEYGVSRVAEDVFRVERRDGGVFGWLNLSEAEYRVQTVPNDRELLTRGLVENGELRVEPHSAALFGPKGN